MNTNTLQSLYQECVDNLHGETHVFGDADIDKLKAFEPAQKSTETEYYKTLRHLFNEADDALGRQNNLGVKQFKDRLHDILTGIENEQLVAA